MTTEKPTLRDQLAPHLPDHASWTAVLSEHGATWTTPAGIWSIRQRLFDGLHLTGPGLALRHTTVEHALGVLRALGAIHDPDHAYTELFAQFEIALALLVTYRNTHGTITHLDELLDDSGWLRDGTAHIPDDLAARLGYPTDEDEDDDPTYDADRHAVTVATYAAFLATNPALRGTTGIHTNPEARDHAVRIAAEALAAVLVGETLTADLSLTPDANAQQHIAAALAEHSEPQGPGDGHDDENQAEGKAWQNAETAQEHPDA